MDIFRHISHFMYAVLQVIDLERITDSEVEHVIALLQPV